MFREPPSQLNTKRMALAFLVAPLVPVVLNAALSGRLFAIALLVGAPIAYVCAFLIALPYAFALRSCGRFNVVPVVVGAGAIAAIPDLLLTVFGTGTGGFTALRQAGIDLIVDGQLTFAGYVWHVLRLLYFWFIGALGGIAFWLIAVGRRWRGPLVTSNAHG
jgi:hypothetical protein